MLLAEAKTKVEMSSPNPSVGFKVALNRKAFKALSGGIYSDEILAVIREISANAYDAHVVTHQPQTPFIIHVPNQLEPFFEVKDFGPGLSEDEILDPEHGIYTTYFASSKENSNDEIGCWGLGSKSPFTYTKQFTVESRQKGIRKVYNCYENEDGFPHCTKFGETSTTEPDGLTVNIPVKREDISKFIEKIKNLFKWWKVIPTFVGQKIEIKEPKFSIIEKEYGILEGAEYNSQATLVMGGIPYSIDSAKISNLKNLDRNQGELIGRIVIFANIGDVEITLGRESLTYSANNKTEKYITNIAAKIEKELRQKFNDLILKCKSLNEAKKVAKDYCFSFSTFVWNNKLYHSSEYIHGVQKLGREKKYLYFVSRDKTKITYLQCFENVPVFKLDHPRMAKARIENYLAYNGLQPNYYLYKDNEYDLIMQEYGVHVLLVSQLPKVKGVGTGLSVGTRLTLKEYISSHKFTQAFRKPTVEIDYKKENHIYLPLKGRIILVNGKEKTFDRFRFLMKKVREANLSCKLYAVNSTFTGELDKYNWTSFDNFLKDALKNISPKNDKKYLAEAKNEVNDFWFKLVKHKSNFNPTSKLYAYLEEIEQLEKDYKDSIKDDKLFDLYYSFNGEDRDGTTYQYKTTQNEVYNEYLGLRHLTYEGVTVVKNFVLAIDFYRAAGKVY